MPRQDYDIPGLTKAIRSALKQGEEPEIIYNRMTATSPTEWGAGAGVDLRQQIENVLRMKAGWSDETKGSPFGAADWGPC